MSKSQAYIDKIVACTNPDVAKEIIVDVMRELNLREDYSALMYHKNSLEGFQEDFKGIQFSYRELGDIKMYQSVNDIRIDCSFLYRQISDELSSKVNFSKQFYQEAKTSTRAKARDEILSKEEAGAKKQSESLIREYIGAASTYDEWIKLNALAYANYQELISLLESIRLFTDALAAESRALYTIEFRDQK